VVGDHSFFSLSLRLVFTGSGLISAPNIVLVSAALNVPSALRMMVMVCMGPSHGILLWMKRTVRVGSCTSTVSKGRLVLTWGSEAIARRNSWHLGVSSAYLRAEATRLEQVVPSVCDASGAAVDADTQPKTNSDIINLVLIILSPTAVFTARGMPRRCATLCWRHDGSFACIGKN
jgi:hypothetical protein